VCMLRLYTFKNVWYFIGGIESEEEHNNAARWSR
jgi:hypothetical protein